MFAALHWTEKKLELMSYAISHDERQGLAAGHRRRPEEACNLNLTLKSKVAESQNMCVTRRRRTDVILLSSHKNPN